MLSDNQNTQPKSFRQLEREADALRLEVHGLSIELNTKTLELLFLERRVKELETLLAHEG